MFITFHVSKDDSPLEGKITLVAWSKKGGVGLGAKERVLGWHLLCSAGIF